MDVSLVFSTDFWPLYSDSSLQSLHQGGLEYLKRHEYESLKMITRRGDHTGS